jgi:pimeloyl-ACP methyl ester carboxylesterase
MDRFAASILAGLAFAPPAFAADAYVVSPGYDEIQPKGPASALGLVIWNHGLDGNRDQGSGPPPVYLRRLVAAGWDVVKIKRDGLQESGGWTGSGMKHVERTVQEVESAKAAGYKRVILAGQSYGGAITLEAARRVDVYAIIPSSPGTGVSVTNLGSPMLSKEGTDHLYESLAKGRFERAVPVLPFNDEYSPANPERGKRSREILAARSLPFLVLDDASTWLVSHGAVSTGLMDFAYGACVAAFLDPARTPAAGPAACGKDGLPPSPDTLPEIADLKPMKQEAGTWWQSYEGIWVGAWTDPALVAIAIEKGADGKPEFVYVYGEKGELKARVTYRVPATLEGPAVTAKLPHQDVALSTDAKTRHVSLTWKNAQGRSGALRLRKYEPRA